MNFNLRAGKVARIFRKATRAVIWSVNGSVCRELNRRGAAISPYFTFKNAIEGKTRFRAVTYRDNSAAVIECARNR